MIFQRTFIYGVDDMGEQGWMPDFMTGCDEEYLSAQTDPSSIAHDVVEHAADPNEGDSASELKAVGAYAVGRWGFEATRGNMAGAIVGDVASIIHMGGVPRGPVPVNEYPPEDWIRKGVREGLRHYVA